MIFLGNANKYADNFINSLELSKESRKLARLLLKSEKDCHIFYIKFLGRNRYVIDDLLDYREEKLPSIIKATENKFKHDDIDIPSLNKRFLESAFIQPLNLVEVDLIIDSIQNDLITFNKLYDMFKSSPNVNILKHVL